MEAHYEESGDSIHRKRPKVPTSPFDSVKVRLAVLFAVVLLPPTVLSLILAWNAFEEQKDRARLSVRQFAILASAHERDFFRDTQRFLTNLAAEPAIRQMELAQCKEVLVRALESFPEYISVSVSDRSGDVVCSTADIVDAAKVSHKSWFHNTLGSKSFTLSDYTSSQDLAEPVIVAAFPIRDDDNEIKGVLHTDIDLNWLSLFVHAAGLPAQGAVFLLDKNGVVLANAGQDVDPRHGGLPDAKTLRKVAQRKLIDFQEFGSDGIKRVYSSVVLPHGNVLVLFGLPSETALGWIRRDLLSRILSLTGIWLAGILAAVTGTRLWVTQWISQLRRVARSYSRGDFSAAVKLDHAPVELRDLGSTLLNMAERINAREEDLRQSLEQKDTLLKEIHHRVKNNLQTITSLVNIHLRSASSADTRQVLEEVQARVRALALANRYLYESEDARFVDLELFVGELCQTLYDTLSGAERGIMVEADVESITIASERAVPIALLVTEAVTNAFKHAFPDGRTGQISVALRRSGEATALLSISDDGVGYRGEADTSPTMVYGEGVGMSLISAFARQLGEDLEISGPPGTTITLQVRLMPRRPAGEAQTPAPEPQTARESSAGHGSLGALPVAKQAV